MNACIISVGTELLFGQIENTNTSYLSRELNNLGISVLYHRTVGDNSSRLKAEILYALKDCDLIITTGGLGPTQDDLTKETICKTLREKLELNTQELYKLEKYFHDRKYTMVESNKKQCYFPKKATILENDFGTASGFLISKSKGDIFNNQDDTTCHIISLPGPPREMKPMFENKVKPILNSFIDDVIYYEFIKTTGIGESNLEELILPIMSTLDDITIAPYASTGEVTLRVTAKTKSLSEAKSKVKNVIQKIKVILNDYIYNIGYQSIEETIVKLLIEKNITLSSVESCTGGLFSSKVTSIPGSSKIFDRSIVTYSNRAKEDLGIPKNIIDNFGAVSYETAHFMVEQLYKICNSDICIGVTGIAGPEGGSLEKPVGLVYISLYFNDEVKVFKHLFKGDRDVIRTRTTLAMFKHIYDIIGGFDEK